MNGVVYSTRSSNVAGGEQKIIMEIWIEQAGICINDKGEAFESSAPRTAINHFGTFNIADPICASIREYVERKTTFEQINEKIFSALKQKLVDKKTQHNRIVKG